MHYQLSMAALLLAAAPVPANAGTLADTRLTEARTLDGPALDLQGRVVVVSYWATWCVPCRVEMPAIDAFYRAHRAEGVSVVAVAMDAGGSNGRLRSMSSAFAFPVVRIADVRIPRREIPNGLPITRIYDRHGQLRFDSGREGKGTIDSATLTRVTAPLLRER